MTCFFIKKFWVGNSRECKIVCWFMNDFVKGICWGTRLKWHKMLLILLNWWKIKSKDHITFIGRMDWVLVKMKSQYVLKLFSPSLDWPPVKFLFQNQWFHNLHQLLIWPLMALMLWLLSLWNMYAIWLYILLPVLNIKSSWLFFFGEVNETK